MASLYRCLSFDALLLQNFVLAYALINIIKLCINYAQFFIVKELDMRATVTIEKNKLDNLLKETHAKSKSSAVKIAIDEYLKKKKIEKIKSMKGKLEFDMSADEIRHYER